MPVYLLRAGSLPIVKIGKADDVVARIKQHQTAHWETLILLRQWQGGLTEELTLRKQFADLRIRGEWYSFSRFMMGNVGLTEIPLPYTVRMPAAFTTPLSAYMLPMQAILDAGGGPERLSEAINRSQMTVLGWKQVPLRHVAKVAQATGLAPHELRPDLFPPPVTDSEP